MSIVVNINTATQTYVKTRRAAICDHPSIFTDVFEDETNIAIWQRNLSADIEDCVEKLLASHSDYRLSLTVKPDNVFDKLLKSESEFFHGQALCKDVSELVEMFCVLFDLEQAGLRLTVLDHAMCPRFHVDKVPCRLICTYHGASTEWLPHDQVNREKLGRGNNGLADEDSGLFQSIKDINQMKAGDVAILKGELWENNAGAGLVHRSPQVATGRNRLLLTLDLVS